MYKNLGKNRLGFNVGDVIKVPCRHGVSFMHVDEIKVSDGVTYYYDYSLKQFVNEPIDNDETDKLELANDNDETYKRYKLYLELKKEFEG